MTPEIWQYTLKVLDRKALSRKNLTSKLSRAGFDADDVEEAVARAVELGCCNDNALASWRAASCAANNYGMRRIKEKLRTVNVSPEAFAAALSEQADGEEERALNACRFKLRCLMRETDMRKKREKVIRFLLGRGFSMAASVKAWECTKNSDDTEQDLHDPQIM